jgi:hypothetical protein
MLSTTVALFIGACAVGHVSAQTFQRLGGCPQLGCVFPPDQTDFLSGQFFDIRVEVHAPVNGSEAANKGVPDEKFTFCIQRGKGECQSAAKFFSIKEPALEKWNFSCVHYPMALDLTFSTWAISYFEDLFAMDANAPSVVNVASKAYRGVRFIVLYFFLILDLTSIFLQLALTQAGTYTARLTYFGKSETVANWLVREPATKRKAKNVLFFIGDGKTPSNLVN